MREILYHPEVTSSNEAIHNKSNLPKRKLRTLSDPHLFSNLPP